MSLVAMVSKCCSSVLLEVLHISLVLVVFGCSKHAGELGLYLYFHSVPLLD